MDRRIAPEFSQTFLCGDVQQTFSQRYSTAFRSSELTQGVRSGSRDDARCAGLWCSPYPYLEDSWIPSSSRKAISFILVLRQGACGYSRRATNIGNARYRRAFCLGPRIFRSRHRDPPWAAMAKIRNPVFESLRSTLVSWILCQRVWKLHNPQHLERLTLRTSSGVY